jgi:ABC-type branched-subunit amino acid transport system ATPase component
VTLQVRDIDTFYGTSHILHGVSLDIADRELCAVLGRNGAGKTTLLRSITGVNPPADGSILLDGIEIASQIAPARLAWRQLCTAGSGDHSRYHGCRKHLPRATRQGSQGNKVPTFVFDYFPALKLVINQRAAPCPAVSNSSSRLRGRWSRA